MVCFCGCILIWCVLVRLVVVCMIFCSVCWIILNVVLS